MRPEGREQIGKRFWKYTAQEPYPPIMVKRQNIKYAEILMDDYAGVVSEFTAISQYLYHHFFFRFVDDPLADLLRGIAVVEMYHMDILAETIILLGGDPKIRGSKSTKLDYWNGGFVEYGNSLCEQLHLDIEAEAKAIKNYKTHIKLIDDSYIQAILNRIIKDEERHIQLFNEQKKRFHCP